MFTLQTDADVAAWVYGIIHEEPEPAGGFLQSVAQAAVRADPPNYFVLRPALLVLVARYPKYHCSCEPEWNQAKEASDGKQ